MEAHGPIALRPYQERAVQSVLAAMDRGVRRGLVVMATGLGKTEVFASLIGALSLDPEFRGLVLAHRQELLAQAANRIRRRNPDLPLGLEAARSRANSEARVVLGSVQTLASPRRLEGFQPTFVVCDEAHHAAAATYRKVLSRMGLFDEKSSSFLLGVTATPHRLDNRALFGEEGAIFEERLFAYDIVAGVKGGYLADLRGYRAAAEGLDLSRIRTVAGDYDQKALEREVNTEAINELAFDSWKDVAQGRKTIVFCTGVEHARTVVEVFRRHGVAAETVHGGMRRSEREAIIGRYRTGETTVLTNCEIATEGFDDPATSCILLLRPTQSWTLFAQMVGRGLRVLPGAIGGIADDRARREAVAGSGKPDCVVIDIVSNTAAHRVDDVPEEGKPSLNGLVGLPESLDLKGRNLAEVMESFARLPEGVRTQGFRRASSYEELSAALTRVEMMQELEIPGEVLEAGSDLFWIKVGPLDYRIEVGGGSEALRTARLFGNPGEGLTLRLWSSNGRDEAMAMPRDLSSAFAAAEEAIRRRFFGVAPLASRTAGWRSEPATEAQRQVLAMRGIEPAILASLTRGEAQALSTYLRARE